MSIHQERLALGTVTLPNGETEGLDPRGMPRKLLEEIGHSKKGLLRVLRDKCLDCAHTVSEVRSCTSVDCALWPYRLGTNPMRAERSAAQKAADAAAGERLRLARESEAA